MRKMKRLLSIVLALAMTASIFTACGEKKDEKKDEAAITATAVKFSKDGKYTTTVKTDTVDLSGISAKNVEVRYADTNAAFEPAAEDAQKTVAKTVKEGEKTENIDESKVDIKKNYPLAAKVESVKENGEGYDITFSDSEVAPYSASNHYVVLFNGVNGESNTADVKVEFPEITLTPDVENVVSNATEAKITLTINGSDFEDSIGKDDVYVDDSFDKMEIKSISASGKNLTMQLTGKVQPNEQGIYQWGTVSVKPSGIKDANDDVSAKIDILTESAYIDRTTLKADNGKINTELKVYGVADTSKLTKENVKIDGVKTESVSKSDDNTAKVIFSADKVKSANDFADKVSGKTMNVGDYKTKVDLSQADFYPVFDYVEKDSDNLKLTLKLYAIGGAFDKNLKADAVSFADDFEEAKAESVKVDRDTLATLILSVPANGFTAETMKYNGTVKLSAGAITNTWGEKTSSELSFTRDYSNESLGKGDFDDWTVLNSTNATLNTKTLLEIQKYTRGLNTVFGSICYYGQAAASAISLAKTVLELTGVIKSDHEKVMDKLEDLDKKLVTVIDNQKAIMNMITNLEIKNAENANTDYEKAIGNLDTYLNIHIGLLDKGALYYAKEKAIKDGKAKEADFPNMKGLSGAKLETAKDVYRKYLPDIDKMTETQAGEYNTELFNYIWGRYLASQQPNTTDTEFKNFKSSYENVTNELTNVTTLLKITGNKNPMAKYDYLCSLTYNFDSQSYDYRLSQRLVAQALMSKALGVIGFNEKVAANTDDPTFINYQKEVSACVNNLETIGASVEKKTNHLRVTGISASEVQANPHTVRVNSGSNNNSSNIEYVSDVMISGVKGSGKIAKEKLTQKGYTVIDYDLNKGTGWSSFYIYLGYKTTKNIDEAITGFVITDTLKNSQRFKFNGCEFSLCPLTGDDAFINSSGDLNKGKSGSKDLFLYYTKDLSFADNEAVTSISFDPTKNNSIAVSDGANGDFNQGAGGKDIFMHTKLDNPNKTSIEVETDPTYYPYCYALGKKVAYYKSRDYIDYRWLKGAVKTSSSTYANWSDDQVNNFLRRMHFSSVKDELASAGIKADDGLLTKVAKRDIWESGSKTIVQMTCEQIAAESKSKKDFINYMTYDSFGKPVAGEILNTWIIKGEFIFFSTY